MISRKQLRKIISETIFSHPDYGLFHAEEISPGYINKLRNHPDRAIRDLIDAGGTENLKMAAFLADSEDYPEPSEFEWTSHDLSDDSIEKEEGELKQALTYSSKLEKRAKIFLMRSEFSLTDEDLKGSNFSRWEKYYPDYGFTIYLQIPGDFLSEDEPSIYVSYFSNVKNGSGEFFDFTKSYKEFVDFLQNLEQKIIKSMYDSMISDTFSKLGIRKLWNMSTKEIEEFAFQNIKVKLGDEKIFNEVLQDRMEFRRSLNRRGK